MSHNQPLEARCAYALFKVIGEARRADGERALHLAMQCGLSAYPATEVSAFFVDEPQLLAAYQKGWGMRAYERRVRTDEELQHDIQAMNANAAKGCGQFFELFEQSFTAAARRWLRTLPAENQARAQELLKPTCYAPDAGGRWRYDVEENDVTFVPD
jgi:hypothetical protein